MVVVICLMAEQLLDGVQMRARFQQMGGETVAQRMHGGRREVELLAGQDHEPLQRGTGHGTGGGAHARGQRLGVVIAAAHVGEDQQRMAVEGPVAAQFLHTGRWAAGRRDPGGPCRRGSSSLSSRPRMS